MRRLLLAATIAGGLVLSGCGGGGDSYDNEPTYMGGLWRGNLVLEKNDCGLDLVPSFNFTHAVSQIYTSVDLEDDDGRRFVGTTVGDDGFSVDAPGPVIDFRGRSCTITYRYRYDSIKDDGDRTSDVRFFIIGDCSGDNDCESEYTGEGGRD